MGGMKLECSRPTCHNLLPKPSSQSRWCNPCLAEYARGRDKKDVRSRKSWTTTCSRPSCNNELAAPYQGSKWCASCRSESDRSAALNYKGGAAAFNRSKKANKSLAQKDLETRKQTARRYGLSLALYDGICKRAIEDGCDICGGSVITSRMRRPALDHDHKVEPIVIRGVLCHQCNSGLGLFKDNPEFLYKAAVYLEQSESPTLG